jgi:hypothetical protein
MSYSNKGCISNTRMLSEHLQAIFMAVTRRATGLDPKTERRVESA